MIFLREYFPARSKNASAHPVAQEPARATASPGFAQLPMSEECRQALQMRPPQRVLEILNDINLVSLRLTSMAGFDKEDDRARVEAATMEIGPA
jgi:hypothetical protein